MTKLLLKFILKIHSFSYRITSILSKKLEKDHIHPKHRIMNYHKFFVDNINSGDDVLDVGCGNGALTFDLSKKARNVIGIDIKEENISLAREKYSASNIKYIIGDAVDYKFDQKFNVIILSNVLEHIENRTEFLDKIKFLAPKLLIRVPMINRDWITLYKKELGLEWKSDRSHFTEYTFETFKEEINQVGLKIENYSIQFGEIWAVIKYEQ
jgi:2-polyprenyl-3-methyl-5-hydroxy-6-metoxy-1,4-benzoquinol methylase